MLFIMGLVSACVHSVDRKPVPEAAESGSRLISPPPSSPGSYENEEMGFTVSFPESISLPKLLDLPNQVFHASSDAVVPVCQVFVSDIPEEPLEPGAARIWMVEWLKKADFSEVEIVRAEMIILGKDVEALFLAEKLKWKGQYFWGAQVIAHHRGKRITVLGIDDGRLDRIESTVMSLQLID